MDNTGGTTPPPPPPPPPGEGGGFGTGGPGFAPKGVGDILSSAFDLYGKNAAQLLKLVAIVAIPLTLISALLAELGDDPGDVTVDQVTGELTVSGRGFFATMLILAATSLVSYVIQQFMTGALTRAAAGSLVGRPVDVTASYRYAFSRLGGLIILSILYGLIVAVGFILLIVPGIILGVFLSVAVPAFMIERRTATDSLSRSWNLVSGSWWHAFGTIVVAAILAGIVSGILTAIGGDSFFGYWVTSAIATIITAPFVALVGVLLYVDLRARREGLDATTLGRELDAATA
jgi:hypothetical protein